MQVDKGPGNYCYFKVEAVNIYATIGDVNQLSILRGGSAYLKEAILFAEGKIAEQVGDSKIETISTGASVGYFRITGLETDTANKLKKTIEEELSKNANYKHFTYTVNYVFGSTLQEVRETLIALGRLEQQKQLTSPANTDPSEKKVSPAISEIGGIRPAWSTERMENGIQRFLSESERCRFKKGKEFRRQFYKEEIENAGLECPDIDFTSDLQSMADYPKAGNLNGKIAVIYLDGNKFSGKINQFVSKVSAAAEKQNIKGNDVDMLLKGVDEYLQDQRRSYLHSLIKAYSENEKNERYFYKKYHSGKMEYKARLETLLWGGDEIIFVVPAWLGMEVLQGFYEFSKEWMLGTDTLKNSPVKIDLENLPSFEQNNYRLTHAGGIVFCRAKTPIHKIQSFASKLADNVKEKKGRNANYFDYLVLESVDYPVENSLQDYWKKQYGAMANGRLWLSAATPWKEFQKKIQTIQQNLPKRQLHRLAKELVSGTSFQTATKRLIKSCGEKVFEQANSHLDELIKYDDEPVKHAEEQLAKISDTQKIDLEAWKWLHFIELYDYFSLLKDSDTVFQSDTVRQSNTTLQSNSAN